MPRLRWYWLRWPPPWPANGAIVEEIQAAGVALPQFDYVSAGQIIELGPDGHLTLGYLASCERERIEGGETSPDAVVEQMRGIVAEAKPARIDYISIVDPETMQPVEHITCPVIVALAVRIGGTRLIDNLRVDPGGPRV